MVMDIILDNTIANSISTTNETGSNDNITDYYNNFIIFNVDHLNRAFTTTIVFIWSLYFVISRPAPPQPPPPIIKCIMISSRGIGLLLLFISMAFELIGNLIAFANSNQLIDSSHSILTGAPLIVTLILWNTALALKSVALFIALSRYAPLTKSLSKEPLMPKFQYSCCICLNFISGLIVYPVLLVVILISNTRWEDSSIMSHLFFLLQLMIAEIMFLILNHRMTMALEEGLLMGRNAIQQIRKFKSRNWFIIIFGFIQICSLSVYNIDILTGNVIRTNFAATLIILGMMDIGSALLYGAIVLILCPVYPQSRLSNEGTPINSIMAHQITARTGFTSFHLKNYFQKYNYSEPLSFIFPKRSSQISFDQNQINRDNLGDNSCASSINDVSKRYSTNSAIIINKIVVHKQENLECTQEIQPLESAVLASDKSHRFSNTNL
ncbi:9078_t:CDS:2 [Gigaspora margarita]|uniref:9078_t:CDS:1 n=1 Tax=Gigaspora margarita TaxID=4874 RepID=A0ABN7UPX0_GIGMA|nr:9078_t:CDS:2 [Gigaspora margarita]